MQSRSFKNLLLPLVVHAWNPRPWKVDQEDHTIQDQQGLQNKASLGHTAETVSGVCRDCENGLYTLSSSLLPELIQTSVLSSDCSFLIPNSVYKYFSF